MNTTPSFSSTEEQEMGFSLGDLYRLDAGQEEMKEEEKTSAAAADVGTQTEIDITVAEVISDMADRLVNLEATIHNQLAIILDSNQRQFDKVMEGFRAIQKCWDLSADAQIQMGEAVDQFKQLTGMM